MELLSDEWPITVVRKPMHVNGCLKLQPMQNACLMTWMSWIGQSLSGHATQLVSKSTGANVTFKVKGTDKGILMLTRPDTLSIATFTVCSEHDLVDNAAQSKQGCSELNIS